MDRTPAQLDWFYRQVDSLIAGELLGEDREKLEALLHKDAEARKLYFDYVTIHSLLKSLHAPVPTFEDDDQSSRPPTSSLVLENQNRVSTVSFPRQGLLGGMAHLASRPAVAAILVAVVVIPLGLAMLGVVSIPGWGPSPETTEIKTVATICGSVDVQWSEPAGLLNVGDGLVVGQCVEIDHGISEILFNNGAKVAVEGPASFTVSGRSSLDLAKGSLIANVSPSAVGFQVVLPFATVIDRGTVFGVRNDTVNGRCEVHVFKGVVDTVLPRESDASGTEYRLKTGEGAILAGGESGFQKIATDLSVFSPKLLQEFQPNAYVGARQRQNYILSQSYMEGPPGTFDVVGNRIDLKPGVDNTVCVALSLWGENEGLTVGKQVEVLLPEYDSDTLDGQFLMVSTSSHQPGGQSSFGLRLRRDNRGIWAMPYSRTYNAELQSAFERAFEREGVRKDPGGKLRFIIKRVTASRLQTYFVSEDNPEPVLVDDDELPELAMYHQLHIGVQAYCNNKSRVYSFRDLKIVPSDTNAGDAE